MTLIYRLTLILSFILTTSLPCFAKFQHGISMHGDLKYPPHFQRFDTVNPNAPKGGEINLAVIGTFDSLNPFILKGKAAAGLQGLVYETLLERSPDEPFSLYGLIAESIDVAPDRSWIIFKLNPKAKWQDGQPITVDDVIFSHKLHLEKGTANRRMYYSKVDKVEALNKQEVKFTFKKIDGVYDAEMPLIMGLMTVLPKHHLEGKDFEKTGLNPLLGSGPYKIARVDAGRAISYQKDPNYWGKDLAVKKGYNNFDTYHYLYFSNPTVAFEAFKTGQIYFRDEADPLKWKTEYNFKAVKDGRVILKEVPHHHAVGMQAFVFNTRRPIFADPQVRLALNYAFDFDWINKNLFAGTLVRTNSFFDNTELALTGKPSGRTLEILKSFQLKLNADTTKEPFSPPSGLSERESQKIALQLLDKAGWQIINGQLKNKKTGQPFTFEILLDSPQNERVALEFARKLKRIGIEASVRIVDSSQYTRRQDNYDFDMIAYRWGHSLSPGNEQSFYWSSEAADKPGTRNYPGIKSPAIDAICKIVSNAKNRKELIAATRALDWALREGIYIIPLGHRTKDYIAYWNIIDHPPFTPEGIPSIYSWWKTKLK